MQRGWLEYIAAITEKGWDNTFDIKGIMWERSINHMRIRLDMTKIF